VRDHRFLKAPARTHAGREAAADGYARRNLGSFQLAERYSTVQYPNGILQRNSVGRWHSMGTGNKLPSMEHPVC
jgi:hypothetical protein